MSGASEDVTTQTERIAADLTEGILSGRYEPGTPLPTQRSLMAEYGVSIATVGAAVAAVQRQGLAYNGVSSDGRKGVIVRHRGRTDFYATDALRAGRNGQGKDAFTENAQKTGRTPGTRFEMVIARPPANIAQRLGIGPHDLTVVRTSYQLLDGEPWSRETSYFPRDLAEEVGLDTPYDIPEGTIRKLAQAGYRDLAHRDEMTDEPANPADAADLRVPVGSPLLIQTRTAATEERVTRVTRTVRLPGRVRMIWEHGEQGALDVIRRQFVEVDDGSAERPDQ
jgi:GntR family transcriptional regulator